MQIARIYTEDTNRTGVAALVATAVTGATFTYGDGLWAGEMEKSVVIEIHDAKPHIVRHLARQIRDLNSQSVVRVVTLHDVTIEDI